MNILVKILEEGSEDYRAWCPSLPGCMVHAPSEERAKQKIAESIRCYLCSLDVATPEELRLEVERCRIWQHRFVASYRKEVRPKR